MFNKNREKKSKKTRNPSKASRNPTIVFLVLVIVAGLLVSLTNFITDWMWFSEMGYVSVFFTQLFTQLKFGIPLFIIVTVLLNIYLRHLKKGYFEKIVSSENTNMKRLNLITNIISVLFGLIVAFYCVSGLWFQILQFTNSTDFNLDDPLFGYDISFYIFRFDFLKQCNDMLIGIIVLFLVVSIVLLVLTRPVALKYFNNKRQSTNVESMIGRQGVVLETIDTIKSQGLVEVDGETWSARTDEPEGVIPKDTVVSVEGVQGVKLIVKKKEEL